MKTHYTKVRIFRIFFLITIQFIKVQFSFAQPTLSINDIIPQKPLTTIQGNISGNILTVTSMPPDFIFELGQEILGIGASLPSNTTITAFVGNTCGGIGTYTISNPLLVATPGPFNIKTISTVLNLNIGDESYFMFDFANIGSGTINTIDLQGDLNNPLFDINNMMKAYLFLSPNASPPTSFSCSTPTGTPISSLYTTQPTYSLTGLGLTGSNHAYLVFCIKAHCSVPSNHLSTTQTFFQISANGQASSPHAVPVQVLYVTSPKMSIDLYGTPNFSYTVNIANQNVMNMDVNNNISCDFSGATNLVGARFKNTVKPDACGLYPHPGFQGAYNIFNTEIYIEMDYESSNIDLTQPIAAWVGDDNGHIIPIQSSNANFLTKVYPLTNLMSGTYIYKLNFNAIVNELNSATTPLINSFDIENNTVRLKENHSFNLFVKVNYQCNDILENIPANIGSGGYISFFSFFQNQCNAPTYPTIVTPNNITNYSTWKSYTYTKKDGNNGPNSIQPNNIMNFAPSCTTAVANSAIVLLNVNATPSQSWDTRYYNFACPDRIHRIKISLPPQYHFAECSYLADPGNPDPSVRLIPITVFTKNLTRYTDDNYHSEIISCKVYENASGKIFIDIPPKCMVPTYTCNEEYSYQIRPFNIKLYVDCSNGSPIQSGSFYADEIKIEESFICADIDPPACTDATACVDLLSASNAIATHHCNSTCALGPFGPNPINCQMFKDDFFKRVSVGKENNTNLTSLGMYTASSYSIAADANISGIQPLIGYDPYLNANPGDIMEVNGLQVTFNGDPNNFNFSIISPPCSSGLASNLALKTGLGFMISHESINNHFGYNLSPNKVNTFEIWTNKGVKLKNYIINSTSTSNQVFKFNNTVPVIINGTSTNKNFSNMLIALDNEAINDMKISYSDDPTTTFIIIPHIFLTVDNNPIIFSVGTTNIKPLIFNGVAVLNCQLAVSCDNYIKEVTIYRPSVSIGVARGMPNPQPCSNFIESIRFSSIRANANSDDFPFEFKPYGKLNNLIFYLPIEYCLDRIDLWYYSNPVNSAHPSPENYFFPGGIGVPAYQSIQLFPKNPTPFHSLFADGTSADYLMYEVKPPHTPPFKDEWPLIDSKCGACPYNYNDAFNIDLSITPTCKAPEESYLLIDADYEEGWNSQIHHSFSQSLIEDPTVTNTNPSISYDKGNQTLIKVAPDIQISLGTPTISSINQFDVELTLTVGGNSNFSLPSITFEGYGSTINNLTVTDLSPGASPLSFINCSDSYGNLVTYFELSNSFIPKSTSKKFNLHGFINCTQETNIQIPYHLFYNCSSLCNTTNPSICGSCPLKDGNMFLNIGSFPLPPAITAAYGTPSTICESGSVSLTASATGSQNPYSFTWQPGSLIGNSVNVTATQSTIYTVTAFDQYGCNSSQSVSILVVPKPTVTLSANYNPVCPGQTVEITPSASAQTFVLTDPNNVSQTITSGHFTVTPVAPYTTYDVTATDANGCVGKESIKIEVIDQLTLIGPATTCEQYPSVYTTTNIPNASYNWTFSDNTTGLPSITTVTGTSWSASHNWGIYGGSVNVQAIIMGPCTLSVSMLVQSCCDVTNKIIIPNNTELSHFTSIQNQNANYVVEGLFIIDKDFTFTNCHFYMAPGSAIKVNTPKHLTANGCIFEGCPSMWDGIFDDDGAYIELNYTVVEDALIGIHCKSITQFLLNSSVFNKNEKDIFIEQPGNSSVTIVDRIIRGCVFTCRDIPYSNLTSLTSNLRSNNGAINLNHYTKSNLDKFPNNERSELAIVINNSLSAPSPLSPIYNLRFGDNTNTYFNVGNLYDNHEIGVRANNCNIEIINSTFQNISSTKKGNGIAIMVFNPNSINKYRLKVGGGGAFENNTFIDCGTGVLVRNYTDLNITKNAISKTVGAVPLGNNVGQMGIRLLNNLSSTYNCNENTITNINSPISLAQNSSNNLSCNFNNNTISTNNISEQCETAILLNGPQNFNSLTSNIVINSNDIQNVQNGINVQNFQNIGSVSISQNPHIIISGNALNRFGIKVLNCNYVDISDNSDIHSIGSKDTRAGIILNNSKYSLVKCNLISDFGRCVEFNGDCSPTIQGILHRNSFTNYIFGVDFGYNCLPTFHGTTASSGDNSWNSKTTGKREINNYSASHHQFFYRITNPSFFPTRNYSYITPIPTSNASLQGCIPIPPVAIDPISLDKLIFIRKLAENDVSYPVMDAENKWMFSSIAYEELLRDTTLDSNDSIISDFIDSLNGGSNISKFHTVGAHVVNKDWTQAETENQNINPQNHIEDNLKKFYSYYIEFNKDTVSGDSTWLASMLTALEPIATECYVVGGPAVPSVRTFLSYITNNLYPENQICDATPADSISQDSSNTLCALIKTYTVSATTGATYTWTVPSGTSFTQSGNSISVNWGSVIGTGGTITCTIMDALGNTSTGSYTQAPLVSNPTCITASANNTSCVTATQLSWNPPAGCAAGYLIMLGTNGAGTTTPDNVVNGWDVGNVTSVTLPMLSGGTTYYYQVIPYDDAHVPVNGCSIFSFTSGTAIDFTPTLGNPYIENFDGVSPPELPCGITISDENFPRDGVVWATSAVASCSGNNSIAISKNPNNTTAKDDWFYSVPLNLTAGELYQVDFNAKTDGPQTEGIEAYIGSSPDAATMQSNSSIINSYISNSTCVNTLASDYIATYTGQYFVGVHANGSPNSQTLFVDDLRVSLIPTVKISTETCGDTLSSCERIQCDLINGATSYKFRIENLQLGFSMDYTVNSNNPLLSEFYNAPVLPLPLGETYTVSATAYVNGNWMPFGASCSVTLSSAVSVTASDVSGCEGTGIVLSGTPSGGTFSVANPYTGTNSTTYTYTYTDEFGCASTSAPANLNVNALPTVTASDVSGCAGTAIALSGTPSGGTWSVANPYTGPSATYTHTYTDENGCSNTSSSASISTISCVNLTSTTCNTASFNTCDRLASTTISGATSYKYKFEDAAHSFSQEYIPSSFVTNPYLYQFFTVSTNPLPLGFTYAVSVSAMVNGTWLPYGAPCNVTINPIPTPTLTSATCDITLANLSTAIYTNITGICQVYDYKYEFTEGSNMFEVLRNSASNNFILTWLPSPNRVKYSTTYSVRVKIKIGNAGWGNYGASCTVTTPASPLTQLQTSFCGYTLPTISSLVNCESISGAIDYKYHITGPSNYDKLFYRNQAGNDWRFSWTALGGGQQNMVPNTTYAVEVASNAGGVWSAYGASCNITTPATQWREVDAAELNQNTSLNEATDELALLVYPNPNAINNEFFVEIKGIRSAGDAAQITIYDLVGKQIFSETARYSEGDSQLKIKPNIRPAQGVYMIEAIVNGKKLRQKFVVD